MDLVYDTIACKILPVLDGLWVYWLSGFVFTDVPAGLCEFEYNFLDTNRTHDNNNVSSTLVIASKVATGE